MKGKTQHAGEAPALPFRLLRWFCDPGLIEDVEGDLQELFVSRTGEGIKKAKWLLWWDVLLLFRPGIIRNLQLGQNLKSSGMLKNFLVTAWRNAMKYKGYTLLNSLGLIVGISASAIIFLWVQDELLMDRYHENSNRLYQIYRNMHQSGEIQTTRAVPQPLELELEAQYPEVDQVSIVSWENEFTFQLADNVSYEKGRYVSPEFLTMFSYPLLQGDAPTALADISSVAISEQVAEKFYGKEWKEQNIVGKAIRIDNRKDFTISGVFENVNPSSSYQFDWLINAEEYISRFNWVKSWENGGFRMYVTLKEGTDPVTFEQKIEQEINEHTEGVNEPLFIAPFHENYLHGVYKNGVAAGGRIEYVKILSIVGILILLVACVNYMSLATARAGRRGKEIGLRKVLGARKNSLRNQFLIESILMSLVSVVLSVAVILLALPYFNQLTDKTLNLSFVSPTLWVGVLIITLFTGMLSGSYPAMLMPSFKVVNALKGTLKFSKSNAFFRKGLVIFQFAISMLLIIGTFVVFNQMQYVLDKNLGLDKDNMLYLQMEGDLWQKSEPYLQELRNIPEVSNVTSTSGNPIDYGRSTGGASWDGKDPNLVVEINVLSVGNDFTETMGAQILDGRAFASDFATDTSNYIINEVAANIIGYDDPIGKNLTVWGNKGKIVGVVKDFHMSSMHDPIDPLIIRYDPSSTYFAFMKINGNIREAITKIEKTTLAFNEAYPFRFKFMDEEYELAYRSELTLSTLSQLFAIVSIFISCLGLLGLAAYSTEQRSKEIGIRKVHGAGVMGLIYLLSKEYGRLIILSFIVAVPVAYYFMNDWLEGFEFRVGLEPIMFAVAGLLAFVIGAVTVGLKSYFAATVNPIKTLRDE